MRGRRGWSIGVLAVAVGLGAASCGSSGGGEPASPPVTVPVTVPVLGSVATVPTVATTLPTRTTEWDGWPCTYTDPARVPLTPEQATRCTGD